MLALMIIGIILGVILLLLSLSVTLYVRLTDELSVRWGIGGLKFWLLRPGEDESEEDEPVQTESTKANPQPKSSVSESKIKDFENPKENEDEHTTVFEDKKDDSPVEKTEQEKTKTQKDSSSQKTPENNRDLKETVYFILKQIKAVLPPIGFLMKHLRITGLKVFMSVGGEDASHTALNYAAAGSGIYSLIAGLKSFMTVRVKKIELYADFVTGETHQDIAFKIKLRLGLILIAAFSMIIKYVANTNSKQNSVSKTSVSGT